MDDANEIPNMRDFDIDINRALDHWVIENDF